MVSSEAADRPGSPARIDVVLLRWPEEAARLERLRAVGAPRLLLVGADLAAPHSAIRSRTGSGFLRPRATCARGWQPSSPGPDETLAAPSVDDDGLLRYRGRWVTLSPVERALAAALVDRFGAVVGRDTLVRRAWPGGSPTRNALDVHMLRLRRRIASLGARGAHRPRPWVPPPGVRGRRADLSATSA